MFIFEGLALTVPFKVFILKNGELSNIEFNGMETE